MPRLAMKAPKWRRQLRPRPLPAAASGEMQLLGPSMKTIGICVVYGLQDSRLPSYLCLITFTPADVDIVKLTYAETLPIAVPLDPIDVPNITCSDESD